MKKQNFESTPLRLSSPDDIKTYNEISNQQECAICLKVSYTSTDSFSCKRFHFFCKGCLKDHLKNLVSESKVLKIKCPQDGCQEVLDEKLIKTLLDKQTFNSYKEKVDIKLFIKEGDEKFCPMPGCSRLYAPSLDSLFTVCKCKTRICNTCGKIWHRDRTCLEALDVEFETYSKENKVRFCVMCKTVVQRDKESCTHMTCPVCDHEWCWTCGRELTALSPHKCINQWKPRPPKMVIEDENKVPSTCLGAMLKGLAKLVWLIISTVIVILLLPMFLLWFWDGVKSARNLFKKVLIGTTGVIIGAGLNGAFAYLVYNWIQEENLETKKKMTIALLSTSLIYSFALLLRVIKICCFKRSKGVRIPLHEKRWTKRNPKLFKYDSDLN